MVKIEVLENTAIADIAIRVRADSLEDLIRGVVLAFAKALGVKTGHLSLSREIELGFSDEKDLIIKIFDELIFLKDVFSEIFVKAEAVRVDSKKAKILLKGLSVDQARDLSTDIKALSYHNLEIKKRDGIYEIVLTFDV